MKSYLKNDILMFSRINDNIHTNNSIYWVFVRLFLVLILNTGINSSPSMRFSTRLPQRHNSIAL